MYRNLDDTGILTIDSEGIYKMYIEWSKQVTPAYLAGKSVQIRRESVDRVVIAGMGGSGIVGDVIAAYIEHLNLPVQVTVHKDYGLPPYVTNRDLVIAVSYSGNTEETISSFYDAVKRGVTAIAVSSGGWLEKFAKKVGAPHVKIVESYHPRAAFPTLFFSVLGALEAAGIVPNQSSTVDAVAAALEKNTEKVRIERPTSENKAKALALATLDKIPVFYGFGPYKAVALRLKDEFNENAKMLAKADYFPELNHNDIVGWEGKHAKHFIAIIIRDEKLETEPIKTRIEATKEIIQSYGAQAIEVKGEGNTLLEKIFTLLHTGGLASVYAALAQGIDPSKIESIKKLKKHLETKIGLVQRLYQTLK